MLERNGIMLCTMLVLRTLEVIQDYWIPLHIKPVKVPTISNDLSQNRFGKKVPLFGNKNSNFHKTLIKKAHSMKRFQKFLCVVDGHEAIDFFSILTFLTSVHFWSFFKDPMDQKMTGAKKVTFTKY